MPAMNLSDSGFGQAGGLPHDTQMNGTINTDEIRRRDALCFRLAAPEKTILDHIHSWLVTVDHKKLGMMYIMYGLIFFVVAGDSRPR